MVKWYGGAASEEQYRMDWQAEGINVQRPPVGNVESGIDRVIELFKTNRLFILRSCEMTINQLIEYSRKVDAMGNVTEEIKDKNSYHLADALRYAVAGMDLENRAEISRPSPGMAHVPRGIRSSRSRRPGPAGF